MLTEAQKRAQSNYRRKTMVVIFRINPETEPDVAKKLSEVPNKSGYLKGLVREDVRGA